jgi:phosphopantetheine adenylyltransferase
MTVITWDEEDIKEKIHDELLSLATESGRTMFITDHADDLGDSIYENVIKPLREENERLRARVEKLESLLRPDILGQFKTAKGI